MTRTGCGLLSCPSDSEVLEEKRVKARFVSLDPFASREDGTDEGKRGVVVKGLRSCKNNQNLLTRIWYILPFGKEV